MAQDAPDLKKIFETVIPFANRAGIKAIEIRNNNSSLIFRAIGRLESTADKFVGSLKSKSLQTIQRARYIVLVQSKRALGSLLHKIEDRISEEYRLRQDAIMGRKHIDNNGSASFYLKRITEGKSNGERGKIE